MKIPSVLMTVLALAAVATASGAHRGNPPPGDEKGVRGAVAHFYTALDALFRGDAAPMSAVWSHADDVTYMGPGGGLESGWKAVEQTWKAQAALKLGGKVEPTDVRVTMGGEMAITSNYEKGENTNAKGETQQVSIRATNVFRKEKGAWKMVGHHTDILPYLTP